MNGIDGTSRHAMRIGAGATGGRDKKSIKPLTSAKQTRDRNPMCFGSVFVHTGARARVAPRAEIQIEHEDALTFVKALRGVLVENAVTDRRAV